MIVNKFWSEAYYNPIPLLLLVPEWPCWPLNSKAMDGTLSKKKKKMLFCIKCWI